jgi:hypothetical protein
MHATFQTENLNGKPARPGRTLKDNINMDLKEVGYELDSSGSGQS